MIVADSRWLLDGRYELDSIVGRGSMAEVYRARDTRLDRIVAVKTLRADLARDQIFQARFRREAQSAASLHHPHIVTVYDTGEDMATGVPVPYIVMEFVDGPTVRDLLQDGHPLLERSLEIIDGVLRALEYSHGADVMHRDIKPGNVMVTRNGDVKVMDFGIARAMSDVQATMTQTAQVIGTAQYLSPEQARGERVDSRSDLYSTGCLLYELLTGRPPFLGDSLLAIAYQHVRENPVPPSHLDPEIPALADSIVLRAMAKDPAQRYQTAADMRTDIQRALSGVPIATSVRTDIAPWILRQAPQRRSTPPRGSVPRIGRDPKGALWPESAPKVRPDSAPTVVPEPSPIVLKRPTLVRVSEAPTRRSEPIGDEVRIYDNSKSSSTSIETISISHETDVSASVDLTKTRAISGKAGVGFIDVVSAQASLGNDLARHYSLRIDTKLTTEQSTVVNIPAYTHVKIIFHWYRIRATGMLTIAEQARRSVEIAEVPFEITLSLVFDKETIDINEPKKGQK
jgi:serine/threonine protein kinase